MKSTALFEFTDTIIPLMGNSGRSLCVSLETLPGDLCLIRGDNGAGKSTFLKWLYQWLQANSDLRASVRYLSQGADEDFIIPSQLLDVARLVSSQSGFENSSQKTAQFAQDDLLFPKKLWQTPWNKASLGERQRAMVAGALFGEPKLLILDEPTSAFDSSAEKIFWDRIQKLCETGTAVLAVYHGSSEALPPHKELLL